MKDWPGWVASVAVTAALFAGGAAAALRQPPGVTEGEDPVSVALDMSVGLLAAPPPAIATAEAPAMPPPRPASPSAPVARPIPGDSVTPTAPAALMPPEAPQTLPLVDRAVPRAPVTEKKSAEQEPIAKPEAQKSEPDKAKPKPVPKKEQPKKKPKSTGKSAAAAPSGAASAPAKPAPKQKTAGGAAEASYAKAVLKKIARLSRKAAPAKGTAVVGFVIGADGRLGQVVILTSSGMDALDNIALDHIRRAAPFQAPPQGAQVQFSFEFVAK